MSKKTTTKLTLKQDRFCTEYVRNEDNATKAALLAGYSEKTAYSIASENLKKPEIIKRIAEIRKEVEAPGDLLWEKCKKGLHDCLDNGNHKDIIQAVDKVAKILGMYAPAKVELYVRDEIERKYAKETHDIIEELAGREIADEVLRRLANGV